MNPLTRFALMLALLACAAPLLAQPQRGEAVIYERADFRGRSVAIRNDTGNFEHIGFDDRAGSLYVVSGTWEFCADAYFRGSCRIYGPGQYRDLGGQAYRLSSGRLVVARGPGWGPGGGPAAPPAPGNWQDMGRGDVSVFDAQDFRGFLGSLNEPTRDFGPLGFNDRIASMVVRRGTWEFCTDAHYRGSCRVYGPGEYRSLPSGQDDAYSSARPFQPGAARAAPPGAASAGRSVPGRTRIILFESSDFTGRSVWLDGTVANLEQVGFNDRTNSVIVEDGQWRLCSDPGGGGECHDLGPGRYPAIPQGLQSQLSSVRLH